MNLECNLNIDGFFKGNITSNGGVTIGKSGRIDGTILSEKLIVSGFIQGDVECNTLEILNGGRIEGNLLIANLIIEDGGIFEGISKRKDSGVLELKKEEFKEAKSQ